jgi:hypothetical protein
VRVRWHAGAGYESAMSIIVWGAFIAIAVVLFIFTGVWGGLIWVVVAGAVLLVVAMGSALTFRRSNPEPTGVPRAGSGGGTANERVGQGTATDRAPQS